MIITAWWSRAVVFMGRQEGVQGEPGNRGAWWALAGGVSGFPPTFLILTLLLTLVVEWSGDVPDLTVLLFEAVRSGTTERNAAARPRWSARDSGRRGPHCPRTAACAGVAGLYDL